MDPTSDRRYQEDPHILGLEGLFALFSIVNVLVLNYLMAVVIPYPLVVTWMQLFLGFVYTRVLGEFGLEFKEWGHFPATRIIKEKLPELLLPGLAFVAMICSSNMLLARVPSVSMYPVLASFAVVAHHATRFFGCGQIYRPTRWASLGIIMVGFVMAGFDVFAGNTGLQNASSSSGNLSVFSLAIFFGIVTAIYRGAFLERALHVTGGLAPELLAHQTLVGLVVLPVVILLSRERRFFKFMPTDFSQGWTWLMWGCLSTAAALPLMKNAVANKLIRYSGQPPWRMLELLAIVFVFLIGWTLFDRVTALSLLAFAFVFAGRALNTYDALLHDSVAAPPYKFQGPGATVEAPYQAVPEPTPSV